MTTEPFQTYLNIGRNELASLEQEQARKAEDALRVEKEKYLSEWVADCLQPVVEQWPFAREYIRLPDWQPNKVVGLVEWVRIEFPGLSPIEVQVRGKQILERDTIRVLRWETSFYSEDNIGERYYLFVNQRRPDREFDSDQMRMAMAWAERLYADKIRLEKEVEQSNAHDLWNHTPVGKATNWLKRKLHWR